MAPRKSAEERITTAVRLPMSLHARLHNAAEERERSANYIIVKAVEAFLNQLEESTGETRVA